MPPSPPKTAPEKPEAGPASPAPKGDDLAVSPGPEFVRVRWLKPVGDEAVGSVEWCEHRRAAGLARDGYAETLA
jgi:hypothetical protein